MARALKLVIFDCDGVLIDSEMLSAAVLMEMMAEIGLAITPEIFRSDFLGRSFAAAAVKSEERHGRPMPPDFQQQYRARLLSHMPGNLKIMPGTIALLQAMDCRYCLATSSSPDRLAMSLAVTGLTTFFTGRCFTSSLVANGKPAPDLFFHVADVMSVAPENCLVIEDSEMGVRAALAAGMETWQFRGGAHMRGLDLPDDVVPHRLVADMTELRIAFSQLGLCAPAAMVQKDMSSTQHGP